MSQEIGSEETAHGPQGPDEGRTPTKRSTSWQWLALAILLLIVVWLIWQYIGGVGPGPDTTTTTPGVVSVTPGGSAILPETNGGEVASETTGNGQAVPDVIGMSRSAAIAAIRAAGYVASATDVFGTTHPAGAVFQQNPTGGTRLEQGGTVGLLVQLRPGDAPNVTVPKLIGLSQSSAESKLESLGLHAVLSYFPDSSNPGRVMSQWPMPGDPVAKGGDVQIQITVRP